MVGATATLLISTLLATTRVAVLASSAAAPGEATLQYAHRDAARMAQVLTELGDFHEVWTLRDPSIKAWEDTFRRVADLARRDSGLELLVFYSGHADGQGLLLGHERWSFATLRARLEGSGAAVRVLILDACYAGTAARTKGGRPSGGFAIDVLAPTPVAGSAILAASSANELAQESSEIAGSFFTHHLLSALRGAGDRDDNGVVTLDEAYDYAAKRTISATLPSLWGPQHPVYDYNLVGTGALVLTRLTRGTTALSFPAGPSAGLRFYVTTSAHEVVAEVAPHPSQRSRLMLPPGRYRVVRREALETATADITLESGAQRTIEDAEFRATKPELAFAKGNLNRPGHELMLNAGLSSLGPGLFAGSLEVGAGWFWRHTAWVLGTHLGLGQSDATINTAEMRVRRLTGLALLLRRLVWPHFELRLGVGTGVAGIEERFWGRTYSGLAGVATGVLTIDVSLSERFALRTLWTLGGQLLKVDGQLRVEPDARAALALVMRL